MGRGGVKGAEEEKRLTQSREDAKQRREEDGTRIDADGRGRGEEEGPLIGTDGH